MPSPSHHEGYFTCSSVTDFELLQCHKRLAARVPLTEPSALGLHPPTEQLLSVPFATHTFTLLIVASPLYDGFHPNLSTKHRWPVYPSHQHPAISSPTLTGQFVPTELLCTSECHPKPCFLLPHYPYQLPLLLLAVYLSGLLTLSYSRPSILRFTYFSKPGSTWHTPSL